MNLSCTREKIWELSGFKLHHLVHSPPLASSSQTPPFWQGLLSHACIPLQHWNTPNTRLCPSPAHSAVSPALIGSPFSSMPSRQPVKLCGCWATSAMAAAKSKAPWERIILQGSVRVVRVGCCWSRVSRREVELTSSRTLCHWPSATRWDVKSKEPGEASPQLNLKSSCPSVT